MTFAIEYYCLDNPYDCIPLTRKLVTENPLDLIAVTPRTFLQQLYAEPMLVGAPQYIA